MPPLWTLERLERACRKALVERGRVRLKALESVSAQVEWTDGGLIKADVDPLTVSHIAGVVHELMHPILEKEMEVFVEYTKDGRGEWRDDLGELAFNAWERALVNLITTSKRRKRWWRSAILQATRPR